MKSKWALLVAIQAFGGNWGTRSEANVVSSCPCLAFPPLRTFGIQWFNYSEQLANTKYILY